MKEVLTDNNFEKKILDLLNKELLSVSRIAKKLGIRRDVATGYLEALKNQGKLEFHRVGKSNIYTIPQKQKMNKFIFFSVLLVLIIIPLASITPIITEDFYQFYNKEKTIVITSSFFMDGVKGKIFSDLNIPPLSTPSTLTSTLISKIFCSIQGYSFREES